MIEKYIRRFCVDEAMVFKSAIFCEIIKIHKIRNQIPSVIELLDLQS